MQGTLIENFGRNVSFRPRHVFRPKNETEVLQILRDNAGAQIRVGGSLHAWSDSIVSKDIYLELQHLDSIEITRTGNDTSVTVGAGVKVKTLIQRLNQDGLTMCSLGLIQQQTIVGATSTGTHGSGKSSMSHYIEELRIATYDSETGEPIIRTISGGDELRAARCAVGSLGVILSVKLRCRPQYFVLETANRYDNLEEVIAKEEEFPLQQFFYIPWMWSYFGQHRKEVDQARSWHAPLYRTHWFLGTDIGLHLIVILLVRILNSRKWIKWFYKKVFAKLIVRNWRVVDRSDRNLTMEHQLFRHVEIELFVTQEKLPAMMQLVTEVLRVAGESDHAPSQETLAEVERIGMADELKSLAGNYCHHYPICIRKVLPDDTMISMATGNDTVYAISLITYERGEQREGFFEFARFIGKSAARLFRARPHWGKVNPLGHADIERLYPELPEFHRIRESFDRDGVFSNNWLKAAWGIESAGAQP